MRAPRLRMLRRGAVCVALAGIGVLYASAVHREQPLVEVRDITPLMNHASVRVAGRVAGRPYVRADGGRDDYARVELTDGDASLHLVARDEAARALSEWVPPLARGDMLAAAGTIRVRPDGRLDLHVHDARAIRRSFAGPGDETSGAPAASGIADGNSEADAP